MKIGFSICRKLAELGYKRSAKKCKEKFENVQKYYKRTKEGRAGRQDGKSYKFFSQLEALHGPVAATSASPTVSLIPPTTNNPTPISSSKAPISTSMAMFPSSVSSVPSTTRVITPAATTGIVPPLVTISFSSNSSSSSPETEDDEDDNEDEGLQGEPSHVSRKRKRESSSSKRGSSTTQRMMEFFENLMKQVLQRQEAMQSRFLGVIEKREQERMMREEAWQRQEIARLTHEQGLMAQERALSASRDAAIISFLQKITGQMIQLPDPPININPASALAPPIMVPPPPQPSQQQQQHHHHQHNKEQQVVHHRLQSQQISPEVVVRHQPTSQSVSTDHVVMAAVPEKQVPTQGFTGGGFDPASSRWPKAEVLALIKLRSGLESRYQDAGPKGPLWEEISAEMQQMGYMRSAKRCKEKWENINKYFKKVKESNKNRPEDAKTCPYFHELDALHRKKVIGGSSSAGSCSNTERQLQQEKRENIKSSDSMPAGNQPVTETSVTQPKQHHQLVKESENKTTGASIDLMETSTTSGLPTSFIEEGKVRNLSIALFNLFVQLSTVNITSSSINLTWMCRRRLIMIYVIEASRHCERVDGATGELSTTSTTATRSVNGG